MTLVATVSVEGVPLLLTDILLSGRFAEGRDEPPLPTLNRDALSSVLETSNGMRSGFELCRKVERIGEGLILGWSGGADTARRVIGFLGDSLADGDITVDRLAACLRHCDVTTGHRLSLTGWILVGLSPIPFHWDSASPDDLSTEEFVAGSGASLFSQARSTSSVFSAAGVPTDIAIRAALTWANQLLASEVVTASTLRDGFGAGFEIHYYDGKAFVPIESVTYVYWRVNLDFVAPFSLGLAPFVVRYSYDSGYLICQTARGSLSSTAIAEPQQIVFDELELHAVPPVVPLPRPQGLAFKSFAAQFYSHVLALSVSGQPALIGTVLSATEGPMGFDADEDGRPTRVGWGHELVGRLYGIAAPFVLSKTGVADSLLANHSAADVLRSKATHPELARGLSAWGDLFALSATSTTDLAEFIEADRRFELALLLCPDDIQTLCSRAMNLGRMALRLPLQRAIEERTKAYSLFERAMSLNPSANAFLGWARVGVSDAKAKASEPSAPIRDLLRKAIDYFRRGIELVADADVHLEYARALRRLAAVDVSSAEVSLRAAHAQSQLALALRPEFPAALIESGIDQMELGKFASGAEREGAWDDARRCFEGARPDCSGEAAYNLACLWSLRGDEKRSHKFLKQAVKSRLELNADQVRNDPDLVFVRNKQWFSALLQAIGQQETAAE